MGLGEKKSNIFDADVKKKFLQCLLIDGADLRVDLVSSQH